MTIWSTECSDLFFIYFPSTTFSIYIENALPVQPTKRFKRFKFDESKNHTKSVCPFIHKIMISFIMKHSIDYNKSASVCVHSSLLMYSFINWKQKTGRPSSRMPCTWTHKFEFTNVAGSNPARSCVEYSSILHILYNFCRVRFLFFRINSLIMLSIVFIVKNIRCTLWCNGQLIVLWIFSRLRVVGFNFWHRSTIFYFLSISLFVIIVMWRWNINSQD